jgi:hypothetical protein
MTAHVTPAPHCVCAVSGAALNPARVIGPLAVYRCGTDVAW